MQPNRRELIVVFTSFPPELAFLISSSHVRVPHRIWLLLFRLQWDIKLRRSFWHDGLLCCVCLKRCSKTFHGVIWSQLWRVTNLASFTFYMTLPTELRRLFLCVELRREGYRSYDKCFNLVPHPPCSYQNYCRLALPVGPTTCQGQRANWIVSWDLRCLSVRD